MNVNPRALFLTLYIFCNIAATFIFLERGFLGGDFKDFIVQDDFLLITVCVFVVVSYILLLTTVFNKLSSIFLSKNSKPRVLDKSMHFFILFIQMFFLLYCMETGAYIAGSNVKVTNPIKYLWILIPVDYVFLVYYAVARESKFFKYNLIIYIFSNIVRGWTGFFVLVLFLESYYQFVIKKKKLEKKHIISFFVLLFVVVPLLISVKWAIRAADTVNLETLLIIVSSAYDNFLQDSEISFLEVFGRFFVIIVERLQHVANVYQIAQYSDVFWHDLVKGNYLPFIFEGLPQYTILKFMGIEYVDLHVYLPQFFYGNKFQGVNNSFHTGFVSWLMISPLLWVFYLGYMFLLVSFSMALMKRLNSALGTGLIWLSILMFIMNGWLNAYFNLIIALIFFNFVVSLKVGNSSETKKKN